jgi:hypothetical protein
MKLGSLWVWNIQLSSIGSTLEKFFRYIELSENIGTSGQQSYVGPGSAVARYCAAQHVVRSITSRFELVF